MFITGFSMITEKKFNSCVLPGVLDVCANFDLFVTAFNSEDFPTLDLPKKATSGRLLISKPSIFATPFTKAVSYTHLTLPTKA